MIFRKERNYMGGGGGVKKLQLRPSNGRQRLTIWGTFLFSQTSCYISYAELMMSDTVKENECKTQVRRIHPCPRLRCISMFQICCPDSVCFIISVRFKRAPARCKVSHGLSVVAAAATNELNSSLFPAGGRRGSHCDPDRSDECHYTGGRNMWTCWGKDRLLLTLCMKRERKVKSSGVNL